MSVHIGLHKKCRLGDGSFFIEIVADCCPKNYQDIMTSQIEDFLHQVQSNYNSYQEDLDDEKCDSGST